MNENSFRVLVVDDEPEIRRFLRASLKTHQHEVIEAENGTEALYEVCNELPDLMILDLGLPDIDGVEVTRRVPEWSEIPIIILSVRNREAEKIEALNAGADDYLTKPFGVGELLARIRVIMRRVVIVGTHPIYICGDLVVNLDRHEVRRGGTEIPLTPTEFELLNILIQNAGKVVTQRHLIHKVWGAGYEDEKILSPLQVPPDRRPVLVAFYKLWVNRDTDDLHLKVLICYRATIYRISTRAPAVINLKCYKSAILDPI